LPLPRELLAALVVLVLELGERFAGGKPVVACSNLVLGHGFSPPSFAYSPIAFSTTRFRRCPSNSA
jgi:hypothetical protein